LVLKAKPMLVIGSPHALLPISTLTLKTQSFEPTFFRQQAAEPVSRKYSLGTARARSMFGVVVDKGDHHVV
jgi:hypothetical protein